MKPNLGFLLRSEHKEVRVVRFAFSTINRGKHYFQYCRSGHPKTPYLYFAFAETANFI